MIDAYNMDVSMAARKNDIERLREFHASGARLDCCDEFGDSLLNIACRRSNTKIVKFLLEEAKASVFQRDDTGRTPLHDACWTATPNFEVVDLLLNVAPELALIPDHRGFAPFDYARRADWALWSAFLAERRSLFRRGCVYRDIDLYM